MRMTIVDDDVEVDENEENDCNSHVDDNHQPSLPCLVKCTSVLTFQLPTFVIDNDIFHLFCFCYVAFQYKFENRWFTSNTAW